MNNDKLYCQGEDVKDFEISLTEESISNYRQQPVTQEVIEEILQDAMESSSRDSSKLWQFVVITDVDVLCRVAEINPDAAMVSQSLIAVLVCGDRSLETVPGGWVGECSTVAHNLLPAAHHKGLAAVLVGIHPEEDRKEKIRNLFGLPEHIMPHTLLMLGYPAHKVSVGEKLKSGRIHYNSWER